VTPLGQFAIGCALVVAAFAICAFVELVATVIPAGVFACAIFVGLAAVALVAGCKIGSRA
jgi:hypothetical protein